MITTNDQCNFVPDHQVYSPTETYEYVTCESCVTSFERPGEPDLRFDRART